MFASIYSNGLMLSFLSWFMCVCVHLFYMYFYHPSARCFWTRTQNFGSSHGYNRKKLVSWWRPSLWYNICPNPLYTAATLNLNPWWQKSFSVLRHGTILSSSVQASSTKHTIGWVAKTHTSHSSGCWDIKVRFQEGWCVLIVLFLVSR